MHIYLSKRMYGYTRSYLSHPTSRPVHRDTPRRTSIGPRERAQARHRRWMTKSEGCIRKNSLPSSYTLLRVRGCTVHTYTHPRLRSFMSLCVCVALCRYVYLCVHLSLSIRTYLHQCTYPYRCLHKSVYVCMYVRRPMCACVYVHACMYACA